MPGLKILTGEGKDPLEELRRNAEEARRMRRWLEEKERAYRKALGEHDRLLAEAAEKFGNVFRRKE